MVLGVVVFCSVEVWGIEWCMLCAGGCGIVDPRSVEETLRRGGQVPQHAGQSITSPLRASSPQGLTHTQTHTHAACFSSVSSSVHGVTYLDGHKHMYSNIQTVRF